MNGLPNLYSLTSAQSTTTSDSLRSLNTIRKEWQERAELNSGWVDKDFSCPISNPMRTPCNPSTRVSSTGSQDLGSSSNMVDSPLCMQHVDPASMARNPLCDSTSDTYSQGAAHFQNVERGQQQASVDSTNGSRAPATMPGWLAPSRDTTIDAFNNTATLDERLPSDAPWAVWNNQQTVDFTKTLAAVSSLSPHYQVKPLFSHGGATEHAEGGQGDGAGGDNRDVSFNPLFEQTRRMMQSGIIECDDKLAGDAAQLQPNQAAAASEAQDMLRHAADLLSAHATVKSFIAACSLLLSLPSIDAGADTPPWVPAFVDLDLSPRLMSAASEHVADSTAFDSFQRALRALVLSSRAHAAHALLLSAGVVRVLHTRISLDLDGRCLGEDAAARAAGLVKNIMRPLFQGVAAAPELAAAMVQAVALGDDLLRRCRSTAAAPVEGAIGAVADCFCDALRSDAHAVAIKAQALRFAADVYVVSHNRVLANDDEGGWAMRGGAVAAFAALAATCDNRGGCVSGLLAATTVSGGGGNSTLLRRGNELFVHDVLSQLSASFVRNGGALAVLSLDDVCIVDRVVLALNAMRTLHLLLVHCDVPVEDLVAKHIISVCGLGKAAEEAGLIEQYSALMIAFWNGAAARPYQIRFEIKAVICRALGRQQNQHPEVLAFVRKHVAAHCLRRVDWNNSAVYAYCLRTFALQDRKVLKDIINQAFLSALFSAAVCGNPVAADVIGSLAAASSRVARAAVDADILNNVPILLSVASSADTTIAGIARIAFSDQHCAAASIPDWVEAASKALNASAASPMSQLRIMAPPVKETTPSALPGRMVELLVKLVAPPPGPLQNAVRASRAAGLAVDVLTVATEPAALTAAAAALPWLTPGAPERQRAVSRYVAALPRVSATMPQLLCTYLRGLLDFASLDPSEPGPSPLTLLLHGGLQPACLATAASILDEWKRTDAFAAALSGVPSSLERSTSLLERQLASPPASAALSRSEPDATTAAYVKQVHALHAALRCVLMLTEHAESSGPHLLDPVSWLGPKLLMTLSEAQMRVGSGNVSGYMEASEAMLHRASKRVRNLPVKPVNLSDQVIHFLGWGSKGDAQARPQAAQPSQRPGDWTLQALRSFSDTT